MCYEHDPAQCHRTILAERVQEQTRHAGSTIWRRRRLGLEQVFEIEALGVMASSPSGVRGQSAGVAVPIELDAIAVRIAEIERLADAMVAGAIERDTGRDQPAERVGQGGAGRIEDRRVVQAGRARARAGSLRGFPRC